ncbi:MAG: hypothetical protein PHV34_24620, partial [Verrucomicrobiae bacterium]|nr:hypothetical protein [Verrucomicrobiae bacterium]
MISSTDRQRLRSLAAEYAEIANSPSMNARREIWRRSNRLEERTVLFQIEDNGTFFADLLPKPQCEGEFERELEHELLRAITNYRLIGDDRVFPPYYCINWIIERPGICPELRFRIPPFQKRPGIEGNRERKTPPHQDRRVRTGKSASENLST